MTFLRFIKGLGLVVLLTALCSCAVIHHMDELLMMGSYARDKNVQGKIVDQINAHYDALLAVINTGKIKDYPNEEAITTNFGEPIAKKAVDIEGQKEEQWLYRDAIPQKAKDKLYLYFNQQGKLIKFTQEKIEWF